jgi:hypothetical protein
MGMIEYGYHSDQLGSRLIFFPVYFMPPKYAPDIVQRSLISVSTDTARLNETFDAMTRHPTSRDHCFH